MMGDRQSGLMGYTRRFSRLSVAQCLHVPAEWCSKASIINTMRWLWEMQFTPVWSPLAELGDT
jgi:hypothetical protein